jgi:hypothetical protein
MELQGNRVPILLAVTAIGIVFSAVVFGVLSASQNIQNSGNIKAVGVGVYTDSGCTTKATRIDWGALTPGATKNATLYVRNEGTINVILSMTTNNWTSAQASSYITLIWNRQGQTLSRQTTTTAMLMLRVSANVTGVDSFGFSIVMTGTEAT